MTVSEFDRDCWLMAKAIGYELQFISPDAVAKFLPDITQHHKNITFHTAYSSTRDKRLLLIEFLGYTDEGWKRALCGTFYKDGETFGFVE